MMDHSAVHREARSEIRSFPINDRAHAQMSQEIGNNDVLGKKREIGATFAHAKRRLTDETLDAHLLHGLNDVPRPVLAHGCAPSAWRTVPHASESL